MRDLDDVEIATVGVNDFRVELGADFFCNECKKPRRRGYDFVYIDGHRYAYIERLCNRCTGERLEGDGWEATTRGFVKDAGFALCGVGGCKSCEKAERLEIA